MRKVRCAIPSANAPRFFTVLKLRGIDVFDIRKEESNAAFFVEKKQCAKTVDIAKELCYNMTVLDDGRALWKKHAAEAIALVLAIVLAFGIPALAWSKVGKIEVTGETVYGERILRCMDELGIKVGMPKSAVDLSDLSDALSSLDGISRVQTAFVGTVLRVSVRDSVLPDDRIDLSYGNGIRAVCDAIVTKIAVTAGTPAVQVGDVVTTGALLVEGVEGEGEERKEVVARAVIYGETWSTSYRDFRAVETRYLRTGDFTRRVAYLIGDRVVHEDRAGDPYEHSETEERVRILAGALRVKETIYYETAETQVTRDFDSERAGLEETVRKEARLSAPAGVVKEEFVIITEEADYTRIRGVVIVTAIISGAIL